MPVVSFAGPPYLTDDPEPVPLRHWELYLSTQSEFSHQGFVGTAPHFEVNYGAARNLQLHATAPLVLASGGGSGSRYGPGDLELGAKYRFIDEDRAGVQVGIFPLVTLPTGSSARGLGVGAATALFPVWFQKSIGPCTTYGGAGYRLRTAADAEDSWFFGWQAQYRRGVAAVGAEVFHETRSSRALNGATGFSAGAVVDVSALHHLLISVGEGEIGRDVIAYLGWQVTFGPEGEPAPGTSAREHVGH